MCTLGVNDNKLRKNCLRIAGSEARTYPHLFFEFHKTKQGLFVQSPWPASVASGLLIKTVEPPASFSYRTAYVSIVESFLSSIRS